jgi:hypothetical protein
VTSSPHAKTITTEEQAIAAVHADIRNQGRDPARVECSAMELEDSWNVTAWRIIYPENAGSSRFVPGGFTTYIVGHNGDILKRVPGY